MTEGAWRPLVAPLRAALTALRVPRRVIDTIDDARVEARLAELAHLPPCATFDPFGYSARSPALALDRDPVRPRAGAPADGVAPDAPPRASGPRATNALPSDRPAGVSRPSPGWIPGRDTPGAPTADRLAHPTPAGGEAGPARLVFLVREFERAAATAGTSHDTRRRATEPGTSPVPGNSRIVAAAPDQQSTAGLTPATAPLVPDHARWTGAGGSDGPPPERALVPAASRPGRARPRTWQGLPARELLDRHLDGLRSGAPPVGPAARAAASPAAPSHAREPGPSRDQGPRERAPSLLLPAESSPGWPALPQRAGAPVSAWSAIAPSSAGAPPPYTAPAALTGLPPETDALADGLPGSLLEQALLHGVDLT